MKYTYPWHLLSLLTLALASQPAQAYVYAACTTSGGVKTTRKWPASVPSVSLKADPVTVGCRDMYPANPLFRAFETAFAQWSKQTQARFTVNLESRCAGTIPTAANDKFNAVWMGDAGGAQAVTWVAFRTDICEIQETDIVVDPTFLSSYPEAKRPERVYDVALHEIGHVYGLDHETRYKSCMGPATAGIGPAGIGVRGIDTDCSVGVLSRYGQFSMINTESRTQWSVDFPSIQYPEGGIPPYSFGVLGGRKVIVKVPLHRLGTLYSSPRVELWLRKADSGTVTRTSPIVQEKNVVVTHSEATGTQPIEMDFTLPANTLPDQYISFGIHADTRGTYSVWDNPIDNFYPFNVYVERPAMRNIAGLVADPPEVPVGGKVKFHLPSGVIWTEKEVRANLTRGSIGFHAVYPTADTNVLEYVMPVESATAPQSVTLVSERLGLTLTGTVRVKSAPPTIVITGPLEAKTGTQVVLDSTNSVDPDGAKLAQWGWEQTAGPTVTAAAVAGTNARKISYTAPAAGQSVSFKFSAVDQTSLISSGIHTLKVPLPPKAVAKSSPNPPVSNSTVKLSARESIVYAKSATYSWKQTGGTPVTLTGANTIEASFLYPATRGNYSFEVTVRDSVGQEAKATTSVLGSNAPPRVWIVEKELIARPGFDYVLHAQAQDPEGKPVTFLWRGVPPMFEFSLSNTNSANVNLYVQTSTFPPTQTILEVVGTDADGRSSSAQITVKVPSY